MKRLLKFVTINIFFVLIFVHLPSNAQQWQWVNTFGGSENCTAYGIASDNEGNIIITGSFQGQ